MYGVRWFAILWPIWAFAADAAPQKSNILVDCAALSAQWRFDIQYATPNNFTHQQQYTRAKCYLRPEVAQKMLQAQALLQQRRPNWHLLFKDCYRPLHVQQALWRFVAGTPHAMYVSNPNRLHASVHTFGAAVDVTLMDAHEQEVDMGTPFDSFSVKAQPRFEARFEQDHTLTAEQLANRRLLRSVMQAVGMKPISTEWWHFDAYRHGALVKRYQRLDMSFEALEALPSP